MVSQMSIPRFPAISHPEGPSPVQPLKGTVEPSSVVSAQHLPSFALPYIFRFLSPQDLHRVGTVNLLWQRTTVTARTSQTDQCGYRFFPNGTKEWGKFDHEHNRFIPAYKIESDGSVVFIAPNQLIEYADTSSKKYRYESVAEFEGGLVVLEEIFDEYSDSHYIIGKTSLLNVVWNAAKEGYNIPRVQGLKKVLTHKGFKKYFPTFLESALTPDESRVPRLFALPESAAIAIMEAGVQGGYSNPLQIVNGSGTNLFIHAACSKNYELVEKLIELFPGIFESTASDVVEKLIVQGHTVSSIQSLIARMKKPPDYYELWLQIGERSPLNEAFYEKFSVLSTASQKLLYQAAFAYNNPFLHEPADTPIHPKQYSVNLMWINNNKMAGDQEFLFGDGLTYEERASDFHIRFVTPVSKWAKKNPGSSINIWLDSAMATSQAIERCKMALQASLEGTSHGIIQFRDVRTMEVVLSLPEVFSESMPIYFRVDLLRAIAADYVLRNKENQFFVYGDLDVEPLSANELFDKRTVSFLDDFGFVMAKGGHLGFENSFQILNGSHLKFMDSHRKIIINLSIEMALEKPYAIKAQQIYDSYPAMMTHFLDADGRYGKLTLKRGLSQFRYDKWSSSPFLLGNRNVTLREIMPSKPVRVPRSHFTMA